MYCGESLRSAGDAVNTLCGKNVFADGGIDGDVFIETKRK